MHHSCTCLNGACCWRKIATDHPKNGAGFASFNARQLCFQNTFATEEYQAGNCQDIVVFGKEAATGLHEDSEDSDCWWTYSMAWRWHFRGTLADVMLFLRPFVSHPLIIVWPFIKTCIQVGWFFVLDFALTEYLAVHWFRPRLFGC